MIQITVITVGNLKESYWRDAVAEYEKRLSAFAKVSSVQTASLAARKEKLLR